MKYAIPLALALLLVGLICALPPATPAMAQDDQPETQPPPEEQEMPKEGMLRWAFTQGMTLNFTFNTHHAAISSVKGTTEGAVLRLISALASPDEEIQKKAAELLKKGGQPVLEVLEEYVTHEANRRERQAIAPIIEYLKEHPEAEEAMPDRFIIAEREGRTQCAVDWSVDRVRGPRATVHVKTNHITVRAKQKTLGMEDYEHATFVQGVTKIIDPRTGTEVIAEEPDNPVAAMFFHAMDLDYFFTIDLNMRDIVDFRYANENAEAERKAMNLKDPLQVGPSFRRLPGRVTKCGEEWEVVFEYFAGADGTRVHICKYNLKEIAMRSQRRCARMPWTEEIYRRSPRAPFPGEIMGGGKGEFWMDIDNNVLVFHTQEIVFENSTKLRIPKKDQPDETREFDTFFNNVMKIEMRLNRVLQKQGEE